MWRFCDRFAKALTLFTALACGAAQAVPAAISDETTAGRRLVAGELPVYPAEEIGRWTESCVAFDYDVRPDGRTDHFVLLQAQRGRHDTNGYANIAARQAAEHEFRRFAAASLRVLFDWRFSTAPSPSEEIAVFYFERSEMGGHLMKISARRLDLRTPSPMACRALDAAEVRKVVAEARGHKAS